MHVFLARRKDIHKYANDSFVILNIVCFNLLQKMVLLTPLQVYSLRLNYCWWWIWPVVMIITVIILIYDRFECDPSKCQLYLVVINGWSCTYFSIKQRGRHMFGMQSRTYFLLFLTFFFLHRLIRIFHWELWLFKCICKLK